jgi:hypothetical protein
MAVSYHSFRTELYEEYLSDGGFVASQRENLLASSCGEWRWLSDWDERLEAYLDGLCVGGKLALQVCRDRAAEGDAGELHCALRVFCRAERPDLIEDVLALESNRDPARVITVGRAMKHERTPGFEQLARRLLRLDSNLLDPVALVVGHQRLPLSSLLLECSAGPMSRTVVWALGRVRDDLARGVLRGIPKLSDNDAVPSLALLRSINQLHPDEDWPYIADGVMGADRRISEMLTNRDKSSTLALGLLGYPSAVPELISRLPSPEAAIALQLITGAGLLKEAPVPDEVLDPEERPTTVLQVSPSATAWTEWWEQHAKSFACDHRFRSGIRYSAENLLKLLAVPTQMHVERYWAIEQLAACHGTALSFEVDAPVRTQREWLASTA